MKLRIHAAIALTFALAYAATAAETTYYWGKVNDSYDGSFNDPAHWHVGSASGATGTVPDIGARAYFESANASYTVTFPEGCYTNFACFCPTVFTGKSVVIDGRNTVFVHPENTEGTYNTTYPFCFWLDNTVRDMVNLTLGGAAPNPSTSPHFVISNFYMTATHPTARTAALVFGSGFYDFLHPCDMNWTTKKS